MVKQAIVLAAGEGQRLRPFTTTRPKVMLSIAGKPILQYVIEALAQNGVRDIAIVVGYKKQEIFDYMGTGEQFGVKIDYYVQQQQLGTAHALSMAKNFVREDFLVVAADNLIDAGTIAAFVNVKPNAVLVKKVEDASRYGVVNIERNLVKSITEKPRETEGNIINTGIYLFTPAVFDFIGECLDIPDVLNIMVAKDNPIVAQATEGTWLDVAYPWDIIKLNNAILPRIPASIGGTIESGVSVNGPVCIGKNTVIRANSYILGPAVIGSDCIIGPNACILPSTSIGNNVAISPFCNIENSVIGNDVTIGPGSIIEDSVIDAGCIIKGHFIAASGEAGIKINSGFHQVNVGAMLGTGCNIGSGVVAQPGVIIGNYCQVQAMKLLSGILPDKSNVL